LSFIAAAIHGLLAVLGSPRILIGLWLVNLLFALPFAWMIGESIEQSVGGSLVHQSLRSGFDAGWYSEYSDEAGGIETTFKPTLMGSGAIFHNLEAWLTGRLFTEYPAVVAAGIVYALLWAFLMGGLLDRYARPAEKAVRARFAQAGGLYFFRFVRLALISAVLYYLVFRFHGWMFGWLEAVTRDVTSERTVLWASLSVYLLTAFLLTLVNMSFAYAKVATVVENRKVMLFAALRGVGFVFSFPGKAFALYYGLIAVSGMVLIIYTLIAPGAGQSNLFSIVFAFLIGQIYLVAKLVVRLTLYAGQTHLFKAHAPR
jgi:hypothetical protein